MVDLDIIIPVYNEGENIIAVLDSLKQNVKTSFRVMICYDHDDDNTLPVIDRYKAENYPVDLVKNEKKGVHGAVTTGFEYSKAKAVLVIPADDDYNAPVIDRMMAKIEQGADVVVASRFTRGGCMEGCPWQKAFLVRAASFTLRWIAALPASDASNGFRLFSRRVIDQIVIESQKGFVYSIELLVKAHRLGWKIEEIPVSWFERAKGQSRFRTFSWLSAYLRWYFYAFATTYLRIKPETVLLNEDSNKGE